MFDRIAPRYDLLNRMMSLGQDQRWRRTTIDALELQPGARVLDVATGTGDLALLVARRYPEVRLVGVDTSTRMLEVARTKIVAAGLVDRVKVEQGCAERLPFEARSFDAVTIAFGIRNVPDRPKALRSMYDALRPGGRLAILELTEPPPGLLGGLPRFYVHTVVPWLGAVLSGASEYRYLQMSIQAFPPPEAFAETIRDAGFGVQSVIPLSFGACHLFVAQRGLE
jgi:demethylmenaquinone methyltransferase/2-methoxy-6-polyprenyl-1,4-benzoquinol methylase